MKLNKLIIAYAIFAITIMAVAPSAQAQQITGVPGSPSATTTIDGRYLPPPPADVRRHDQPQRQGLQAVVAAAGGAAQGCAQRAAHHDR